MKTQEMPLFPVTVVGSWPRPPEVLRALRQKHMGRLSAAEFERLADAAVLDAVRAQESAGVDLVTDGEQRRDNFYSFVAEKMSGVRLMTLAEMLEVVEDKAGFERILQTLDVPAYAMKTASCVGKVERREPLAVDEYRFLRQHTDRPIKVPLPGPYLLTRAMWVKELSRGAYPTKEDLGVDVVRVLHQEALALRDAGVDFIQFDEPVLTELVFATRQTRTFMCASLAARNDPAEELEFATSLLNEVVAGLDGVRVGLHICRGNWSQNEQVLLEGSYNPLVPYLERINVQQFVLEFATPRAGALASVSTMLKGKELGLGVVNPRTAVIESPEQIVSRAQEALRYVEPDRLFLNPDCGFGTFAQRPLNNPEIATQKLRAISRAAAMLRETV
jgi:5-methyltetrahydropteroyltriglutamate--homocysteine methyltransferase